MPANPFTGPLLMLAGIGLFGLLDAISKLLSAEHGVWQVLLVRFATILAVVLAIRTVRPGWGGPLRTRHARIHAARAVAMLASAACFFMTFSHLPLVEGYLVFFTSPFFVMAMAAVGLREVPPRAAWAWAGVGFAGVAIGLAPGLAGGVSGAAEGYAWALAGTFCYSLVFVLNRALRGEAGFVAVMVWPALLGLLVMLGPGVATWVAPSPRAMALMVANGVLVGAATALLAMAFRHASASRLAPFNYSGLVWSVLFGLLLFGDVPSGAMVLGAAVVVFACAMSERAARTEARA